MKLPEGIPYTGSFRFCLFSLKRVGMNFTAWLCLARFDFDRQLASDKKLWVSSAISWMLTPQNYFFTEGTEKKRYGFIQWIIFGWNFRKECRSCGEFLQTYIYSTTMTLIFAYLVGGFKHFLFSISYMGCHPSHWWIHIFQDGYCITNQIYYSLDQVLITNNHYYITTINHY